MATPTQIRRRGRVSLILGTLVAALLVAAVAYADELWADGDGVVPIAANPMAFGNVSCGSETSKNAAVAIQRTTNGNPNIFRDGSTVTITVVGATGDGLSAAAPVTGIALPVNWSSQPAVTTFSSAVTSEVTVNPTVSGPGSGTVTYRASGNNNQTTGEFPNGAPITRDVTMNVTWNAGACDTTPPTSQVSSTTPSGYTSGSWTNQNVTLNLSASDNVGGSGVKSITYSASGAQAIASTTVNGSSTSVTINTEGTTTVSFYATDNADNVESPANTFVVKIDKTAPNAPTAHVSPAANLAGWHKTVPVTVSFTSNGDAGLAAVQSGVAGCTADAVFSVESASAAGNTASGTCTDNAGNTSTSASATVKIDLTDPTITASATKADSTSYTSGSWTNQTVTVSFVCNDLLSGIPSGTCPANDVVSSNTSAAGQNVSDSVSDAAGNSKTSNTINVKVDKTDPVVSVTGFTNGQQFTKGDTLPTPGCDSDDLLSGVASSSGPTLKAGTGLVNGVGSATYVCSATDNAGNTTTVESTYTVVYSWAGFFSPVENPSAWNSAKAGQAIPLKFSLGGDQGLNIFASGYPRIFSVACPSTGVDPDPIDEYATDTANSKLIYDTLAGHYNYVWKTDKNWAAKCFRLDVKLNDNTTHSANFKFTK